MWLVCQAAHLPAGSMERLLKVTGFVVSIYSCVYRPFAPFRSPAGETVELIAPDKGIRAIGEKVHAPLSSKCLGAEDLVSSIETVHTRDHTVSMSGVAKGMPAILIPECQTYANVSCFAVRRVPGDQCLPLRRARMGAVC